MCACIRSHPSPLPLTPHPMHMKPKTAFGSCFSPSLCGDKASFVSATLGAPGSPAPELMGDGPVFTSLPSGGVLRLQMCATAFRFSRATPVFKHVYLLRGLTDPTCEVLMTISSKSKLAFKWVQHGRVFVPIILAPKSLPHVKLLTPEPQFHGYIFHTELLIDKRTLR